MSNFMKDMFIEVREQEEPLTQLELLREMVEEFMDIQLPGLEPIAEAERFSMHIDIPKLNPPTKHGEIPTVNQDKTLIEYLHPSLDSQAFRRASITLIVLLTQRAPKEKGLAIDLMPSLT